jgi:oligopeptide/dipeptide ABC transporter ATP-binding protein
MAEQKAKKKFTAPSTDKILEVKDLRISFKTNGGTVKAVRGISFPLYRGRTLAIVGESGSGKSVTSKAILGILANNKIVEDGQIIYGGMDLLHISEDQFSKLRGVKLSMVFQDPLSSLDPIVIVGKQLTEALVLKEKGDQKEARKQIAKIQNGLKKEDAGKAKEFEAAVKAEQDISKFDFGPYDQLFLDAVTHSALRQKEAIDKTLPLIEALMSKYDSATMGDLESFKPLKKDLKGLYKPVRSCRLDISVDPDNVIDVFKIVCDDITDSYKTSTKLLEERKKDFEKYKVDDFYALPPEVRAKRREVIVPPEEHLSHLKAATHELYDHLKALREKGLQENFAREYATNLEKRYVGFVKTLRTHMTSEEAKEKAIKLLGEVGIAEPERRFKQYPFELSGGMRQRIVIAIALCSSPEILICDEPTTALDVTIQAQILELINELKAEKNLSIVFITHDLGVVADMADDIAVMYAGKIVEYGTAADIFYDPRHPYTWALLGSVPDLKTKEKLSSIPGTPPNMLLPPKGDAFAPRNANALEIDHLEEPPFFQVSDTHYAATWNLAPQAPDLLPSKIVIERIREALKDHPEFTPRPYDYKNSVLKAIGLDKKKEGGPR